MKKLILLLTVFVSLAVLPGCQSKEDETFQNYKDSIKIHMYDEPSFQFTSQDSIALFRLDSARIKVKCCGGHVETDNRTYKPITREDSIDRAIRRWITLTYETPKDNRVYKEIREKNVIWYKFNDHTYFVADIWDGYPILIHDPDCPICLQRK